VAVPGWFGSWRAQLEQRRDDLVAEFAERANRRTRAEADLGALQPALAAARAAWRPYQQPINQLEEELQSTLRPAMYKGNHEAHSTARRAAQATRQVADAEARITAIRVEGAPVKSRLDALEAEAQMLDSIAHPPAGLATFDDYDRRQLETVDRLLDTADIYLGWAHGQPTATIELADAVANLTEVAQQASYYRLDGDEISRAQWAELLEPVTELLRDRGIELIDDRQLELEREGPELGLGL